MEKIFSVQKLNGEISLFCIKGFENQKLGKGDIFARKNKDNSVDILEDFKYLTENIQNKFEELKDGELYDFTILEK